MLNDVKRLLKEYFNMIKISFLSDQVTLGSLKVTKGAACHLLGLTLASEQHGVLVIGLNLVMRVNL